MKKTILILAAAAVLASCGGKEAGYSIKGKITGENPALISGKAILTSQQAGISDTVDVSEGKFQFKGSVKSPATDATVTIAGLGGSSNLLLENCDYTIYCSEEEFADGIRAAGGKNNAIYKSLDDAVQQRVKELGVPALYAELFNPATTDERKQEIQGVLQQMEDYVDSLEKDALAKYPNSLFALQTIASNCYDWSVDSIRNAIKPFNDDPDFADDATLKKLNDMVGVLETSEVGKPAIDFTLETPDGKPVAFSDVYKKNKLTMIDFWASWCGPCRRANPTIVKVYKQYKSKGFDILGVSLDNEKNNWVKAIDDDGLVWTNVSDLRGWDSAAGKLYGIRYIPQNVFVDSNGIIVAKRIEPDALEAFLAAELAK